MATLISVTPVTVTSTGYLHALEAPQGITETVVTVEPEKTPEEHIQHYAGIYGVDPKLAVAIAEAESGLNPNAKNPASSASGIFQFIDGTAQSFCVDLYKIMADMSEKNDPKKQAECAVKMLSDGGLNHWSESRAGWEWAL